MANNHTLQFVRTQAKDTVFVAGSFAPNAQSAPVSGPNVGWSVVRTQTGVYTVSLSSQYPAYLFRGAHFGGTTAVSYLVQCSTVSATGTFTINTQTGASVAVDIVTGTDICFILACQNSSQKA